MYETGCFYEYGLGVMQSDYAAADYYQRAAYSGHAESQYKVGLCYYSGIWKKTNNNYCTAADYFRKAAEQGFAAAQYYYGFCFAKGKGVPKNVNTAKWWYQKAAEQGNEEARAALKKMK